MADADVNEDLLDYEEEETTEQVRYNTHFSRLKPLYDRQIFLNFRVCTGMAISKICWG